MCNINVSKITVILFIALLFTGCDLSKQSENIDAIRVSPQHDLKLPDISFDKDGQHYLLEPYVIDGDYIHSYGKHYLIHARRNKSDMYSRTKSQMNTKLIRNYSYFFDTLYPEIRWPSKDKAEFCLTKAWLCPKSIRIHVKFTPLEWREKGIADYFVRLREERNKKRLIEHRDTYFSSDVERKYGLIPLYKTMPSIVQKIGYLHISDNKKPVDLIECNTSTPHKRCEVIILSKKYPMLSYTISFWISQLPYWENIIKVVRNKVDNQIQNVYVIVEAK